MRKINTFTLNSNNFPEVLKAIPEPPKQLYVIGDSFPDLLTRYRLAIVGSRKVSTYGQAITSRLAEEVARMGIVIISGLALGHDGLAHQAALRAGTPTIAVLPCGLDQVYPRTHYALARQILEQGGALVSEYPPNTVPYKVNFLARNRIVAGLAEAVLIPEAAQRSGSLNTANHALQQGKDVLAIPGNITSLSSAGTNNLIKMGATPITSAQDVFAALGITEAAHEKKDIVAQNPEEYVILKLLQEGITDGDELLQKSKLPTSLFNQTLTMLEITSQIKSLGANHWTRV